MSPKVLSVDDLSRVLGKQVQDLTREAREGALCAWAEYRAVTPAMIGDFTGDTIKLIENPADGKAVGAILTGLPTAQQLIGRARWLMRVAVATASGAKTHREAEQTPHIRVRVRGRSSEHPLALGPVELAFGTARAGSSWKGLLSVQVEPLAKPEDLRAECSEPLEYPATLDSLCKCLAQVRDKLCAKEYYKYGEAWKSKKSKTGEEKYVPAGKLLAKNRFNSILAVGSKICSSHAGKSFVPYNDTEKQVKLPGPSKSEKLGFRLTVYIDRSRLSLIDPGDLDKAKAALKLALVSILAVPTLLGLGKGANRGFGRFKPSRIEVGGACNDIYDSEDFNGEPGALLKSLQSAAERLAGGLSGASWESLQNSLIPRLPFGALEKFNQRVQVADKYVAGNINEVLGLIGFAASKISWKAYCKAKCLNGLLKVIPQAAREHGAYYHTWTLGLPRQGMLKVKDKDKKVEKKTGYIGYREDGTEIRRQSFLIAFTLDGKTVHLLGFPSGDILRLVGLLEYAYGVNNNKDVNVEKLSNFLDSAIKLRKCNYKFYIGDPLVRQDDECKIEIDEHINLLQITFNNYINIIKYKRIKWSMVG